MKLRWLFTGIALAAAAVGTGLWLGARTGSRGPAPAPIGITGASVLAATFADQDGRRQAIGQFAGRVIVLNFWATWCAPCREEMPAFVRLQSRWGGKGVQFVGLANEDPAKVHRFGRELAINYPLWTGGEEVSDLSRRLGNVLGVLPHTVILGPDGQPLEVKVGPYTEAQMEERLVAFTAKSR